MSPRNIRINQLVDFLAHHLKEKSTEFECSKCGSEVRNGLLGNLKHLLFDNFLHSPLREHTFLFKAYKKKKIVKRLQSRLESLIPEMYPSMEYKEVRDAFPGRQRGRKQGTFTTGWCQPIT